MSDDISPTRSPTHTEFEVAYLRLFEASYLHLEGGLPKMAFMKTLVRQKDELIRLHPITTQSMFSARQPYLLQTIMMNEEKSYDPDFSLIQKEAEDLLEVFRSACPHELALRENGDKRTEPISLINSEGVCWCCGLHEDDFPAVCEVCGDLCGWSISEAASWCSADCADHEIKEA
jgi:hypothetical protein